MYVSNKGAKISLYCHVSGNPLNASHIKWTLNNKPLILPSTRLISTYDASSGVSALTITNVEESDDGNYTCTANNLIGSAAAASTILNVKRSPVILEDESVLKAAEDSNQGLSARLICKVRAYPDATFKWRLFTNAEITSSSKYSIVNTKLDSQLLQSVLTINTVVSSDYGSYICEAKNEIGTPVIAKATLVGKRKFFSYLSYVCILFQYLF